MSVDIEGEYLASGGLDNRVKLWDIRQQKQLWQVEHDDDVNCVKVHGEVVISASDDKTVKIWNRNDGRQLHNLQHDHWCRNFDVRDNVLVVAADNGVYIWSLNDRRKIKKIDLEEVHDVRIQQRTIIAGCFNGEVHKIEMK